MTIKNFYKLLLLYLKICNVLSPKKLIKILFMLFFKSEKLPEKINIHKLVLLIENLMPPYLKEIIHKEKVPYRLIVMLNL